MKNFIENVKKLGLINACRCSKDYHISKFFKRVYVNKPLRKSIVIEGQNGFDSNGGALFEYLVEKGYNKKYHIVFLSRYKEKKKMPSNTECIQYNKSIIKRQYYLCVSKWIFCSQMMPESLREGQISVYMTHGPFGLKNVNGKIVINKLTSYYLCPSVNVALLTANQFTIEYPNPKELILGYPIYDILYNCPKGEIRKLTDGKFSKVIIWMPTFRKAINSNRNDSDSTYPLGIPLVRDESQFLQLNEYLHNINILLIIKLHPVQDLSQIHFHSLSNIIKLDAKEIGKKDINIYRLLKDTDALISDYSSVAFDYLHLDKPIAYCFDDKQDYNLGFICDDIDKFIAGKIMMKYEDMVRFVEEVKDGEDIYIEKRKEVRDYIFKYTDGKNCERLLKYFGIS